MCVNVFLQIYCKLRSHGLLGEMRACFVLTAAVVKSCSDLCCAGCVGFLCQISVKIRERIFFFAGCEYWGRQTQ